MSILSIHSPLRDLKNKELQGIPTGPYVFLKVGTHHIEDDCICLSPQLMSDGEVDWAVDNLITELEEFRKKAKKELREQKERIKKEL